LVVQRYVIYSKFWRRKELQYNHKNIDNVAKNKLIRLLFCENIKTKSYYLIHLFQPNLLHILSDNKNRIFYFYRIEV